MPDSHDPEITRLRAMIAELGSLNDIYVALSRTTSVQEITEVLIDKSLRHIKASQGAVFLLTGDQRDENVLTTFVRRKTDDRQELPLHLTTNITAWTVRNKRPIKVNSPDEPHPFGAIDFESLGIRSMVLAPLVTRTGAIGVVAGFNKLDENGFTDDDKRFLGILGTQCAQFIESARLYEEEKRLNALRQELNVARTIQQSFLPLPGAGVDCTGVCGFNEPAREVGGDFFDIVSISNDEVFVSIGDVSGKGVPAALFMSNAVAVQRSQLAGNARPDLSVLAGLINRTLCQFKQTDKFITAIFGVFDRRSGRFRYVNAGHPHPVVIRRDGSVVTPEETACDLLLGVLPDTVYAVRELTVEPEAVMCIYTDGVTDAMNEAEVRFEEPRMLEALIAARGESADRICTRLREEVARYRGTSAPFDDITAVVIKT